eukprot:Opistho-1_new@98668
MAMLGHKRPFEHTGGDASAPLKVARGSVGGASHDAADTASSGSPPVPQPSTDLKFARVVVYFAPGALPISVVNDAKRGLPKQGGRISAALDEGEAYFGTTGSEASSPVHHSCTLISSDRSCVPSGEESHSDRFPCTLR